MTKESERAELVVRSRVHAAHRYRPTRAALPDKFILLRRRRRRLFVAFAKTDPVLWPILGSRYSRQPRITRYVLQV